LSAYVQEDVGFWMIDEEEWGRAVEGSPGIQRLEQNGPSRRAADRGIDVGGAVRVAR
jgi:hypothetical protein